MPESSHSDKMSPPRAGGEKPLLSLIITVFRGRTFLADTFSRVAVLAKEIPAMQLEVIAVDDGSNDDSFAEIVRLQSQQPFPVRAVRLCRNYGPMASVQAGIACARGDCVAVLPQDLQDPPESIVDMFASWKEGEKVNMTYRTSRDEPPLKKGLAAIYHFIFRTMTGIDYPSGGLGVFLIDREIADEIIAHPPRHTDILLHIFSMDYNPRLHPAPRLPPKAKTNWTYSKSMKLAIDNFIGFSYLPVRLMSLAGVIVSLASFCFAGYVFIGKLTGWYPINQPPGWATIVVLLTFLSGMTMLMLGVIGEYLWRILDNVRGAPIYRVEEVRDSSPENKTG